MKVIKILLALCFAMSFTVSYAQEKFEVQGAVILGNSEDTTPAPGTVRWTGSDFEGWTGSAWVSLTTGPCGGLTFVKDVDDQIYRIVAIGSQCWMAENLRAFHYNDTTSIPRVPDNADWAALTTPGLSLYDNTLSYRDPYGVLYNWYVVDSASNGNRNVCPSGWRVPTQTDLDTLTSYLGGESVAGNPLKDAGNTYFLDDNRNATNTTGFTAIPGGYRFEDGSFIELGFYAQYWASTSSTATTAVFLDIEYDGDYANIGTQSKIRGNSIRCIKE